MCLVHAVGMVGKSRMIKNIELLTVSKLTYRCNHCLGKVCNNALSVVGEQNQKK